MNARGVTIAGKKKVKVESYELAPPRPGEIQVEVRACGLCFGDVYAYDNAAKGSPEAIGHEAAGVVVALGDAVEEFKKGDKVTTIAGGSMATAVNSSVEFAQKIPDNVEEFEYWIAEPVTCVISGLEYASIQPGDKVAVVGCGFMGLLLLQGANSTLAGDIIAVDIDEGRLRLADQFGAARVFHPDDPKLRTDFDSCDVVIEAAGVQPALDLSFSLVTRAGKVCVFSRQRGLRNVDGNLWHDKGIKILSTSAKISDHIIRTFKRTPKLIERGIFDLQLLVTHTGSLDEAQRLFDVASRRSDGYIKGVIKPSA